MVNASRDDRASLNEYMRAEMNMRDAMVGAMVNDSWEVNSWEFKCELRWLL